MMHSEFDKELLYQLRLNTDALVRNTRLMLASQPQLWGAEALMQRYASRWDEVKALFKRHAGRDLGDKRTAKAKLNEVLIVDEAVRGSDRAAVAANVE